MGSAPWTTIDNGCSFTVRQDDEIVAQGECDSVVASSDGVVPANITMRSEVASDDAHLGFELSFISELPIEQLDGMTLTVGDMLADDETSLAEVTFTRNLRKTSIGSLGLEDENRIFLDCSLVHGSMNGDEPSLRVRANNRFGGEATLAFESVAIACRYPSGGASYAEVHGSLHMRCEGDFGPASEEASAMFDVMVEF